MYFSINSRGIRAWEGCFDDRFLAALDKYVGGAVRRFDLFPMAASGPTRMLEQTEYISIPAVTAAIGSALTAAHF